MVVDNLERKRDAIIGSIIVLTLLLTGTAIIAGETGLTPYSIGTGIVLILITLAYTHDRTGQQERTEDLEDNVRRNELAPGDLEHLRTLLSGQQDEKMEALEILGQPYSQDGTEQSLMAFIAGDSRDRSVAIVHDVIDLLEDEDSDIAREALSVLHNTEVSDQQAAADAAANMVADLQDHQRLETATIRERAIFLAENRRQIHGQTLRDSHELIEDLLTVEDPSTETMAALLIGDLIRRDKDLDHSDIELIVTNLQDLLDGLADLDGADRSHILSFITAHLSVLRRAARTDPSSLEDHLSALTGVFSLEGPQQRRGIDIARALAEDHPRALEPVFGGLMEVLDETDDSDVAGTILQALAHMGPRVTEGPQAFAQTIAPHLSDQDHRRPAAYLLFRLADESPEAVGKALPDPAAVLTDDDPRTRRYGFGILARLASSRPHTVEQHLETIIDALDSDSEVGTAALTALFRYTRATETDVLADLGQQLVPYLEEDGAHARMAAWMLAEAVQADPDRYSSLRPVLEEMLDRDDPEIVVQACKGLRVIGTEESRDRLQEHLGDSTERFRVAAATAFTAIWDRLEDSRDRDPLEDDEETIAEMAADEDARSSIQIKGDGDIHGDILIYDDKDDSTAVSDSDQEDAGMDRD
jgi:hypothetical protein